MNKERDVGELVGYGKQTYSLEGLRNGDRAEFARMVEAHYQFVYRLVLIILGDPQDAEDVLQETFIKAYRHIDSFDGRSKLTTWLYRIATNEALMLLRKRKPDLISLDQPTEGEEAEQEPLQVVDWCCLPENELMSVETRTYLDRAVEKLPPSLRVVFVLRDMQGLSTLETGEVLDLSENAVKTRLSRARLRLREELSGYFGERLIERKGSV